MGVRGQDNIWMTVEGTIIIVRVFNYLLQLVHLPLPQVVVLVREIQT